MVQVRKWRRRNGRLIRQKSPQSRGNARPKKVHIMHGGASRALRRAPLDRRTRIGRFCEGFKQALVAHVGGDPSAVQAELIELAARNAVQWRIAHEHTVRKDGRLDSQALDQYLRIQRELRGILMQLGLRRAAKQIPELKDYIEGKAEVSQS